MPSLGVPQLSARHWMEKVNSGDSSSRGKFRFKHVTSRPQAIKALSPPSQLLGLSRRALLHMI